MSFSRIRKITSLLLSALLASVLLVGVTSASKAGDLYPAATLNQASIYQGNGYSPKTMRIKASFCLDEDFCAFVGTSSNLYLELAFGDPKNFASMKQVRFNQIGEFTDVTCLSKTWCAVVGTTYSDPFVISGDPNTFSDEKLINLKNQNSNMQLTSITCLTQTSCIAAGAADGGVGVYYYGDPTTWTSKYISVGLNGGFGIARQFVRCLSASYCVLAGQVQKNMTINSVFWSGSFSTFASSRTAATATKTSSKTATNIYGLWCFAVDSCLVNAGIGVFGDRSIVLKGSPKKWSTLEIVGGNSGLGGMDCLSITRCSAAVNNNIAGVQRSYVYNLSDPETWANTKPTEISSSVDPQAYTTVECSTSTCYLFALGSDDIYKMFTARAGSFTGMSAQPSVENYGFQNQISINSMRCVSDSKCVIAGSIFKNGVYLSMTSVFNPDNWREAELKIFSDKNDFNSETTAPLSTLRSLSCIDESFCVAVGNNSALEPSFTVGDPNTWNLKVSAGLSVKATLGYVSCVAKDYCVAVGSAGENEARDTKLIFFTGNPATWSTTKPKVIDYRDVIEPSGLSCMSKVQCVITFTTMNDASSAKYFIGNPTAFTAKAISKNTTLANYNSLKCFTKTNCIVAGSSFRFTTPTKKGGPNQLTEQASPAMYIGDPTNWPIKTVNVIPNTPAAKVDVRVRGTYQYSNDIHVFVKPTGFVAVDCLSTTECYAVGFDSTGSAVISKINTALPGSIDAIVQTLPQGWRYANFDAVSCGATQCFAMGNSDKGTFLVRLTQPVQ